MDPGPPVGRLFGPRREPGLADGRVGPGNEWTAGRRLPPLCGHRHARTLEVGGGLLRQGDFL